MNTDGETGSFEESVEAFAAEIAYWREVRGAFQEEARARHGLRSSYVSHSESGRHRPTEDFARRADEMLNAGKAIWRRWQEYDAVRPSTRSPPPVSPTAPLARVSDALTVFPREDA